MTKPGNSAVADWIGGPRVDLLCFGFGWVPLFLLFVLTAELGHRVQAWPLLLVFVLAVSFVHRHLTFPLVYGDGEQFRARRWSYLLFPVFFFGITALGVYYVLPGQNPARPVRPLITVLAILSVTWNIYHVLMQKMGILRIYSRKAGYGKPWVDKAMVWAWFVFLTLQLLCTDRARRQAAIMHSAARVLVKSLESVQTLLPILTGISLVAALVVTAFYLRQEWEQGKAVAWPKNIFLLSILLLYSTLLYNFYVGYVVFGFSHALEYLAFVNLFSRKKYLARPAESSPMARWIRRQAAYFAGFAVSGFGGYLLWRYWSADTLNYYIIGSSFLHFLFDGWIWKVRDPKVAQPLGIQTQPALS